MVYHDRYEPSLAALKIERGILKVSISRVGLAPLAVTCVYYGAVPCRVCGAPSALRQNLRKKAATVDSQCPRQHDARCLDNDMAFVVVRTDNCTVEQLV